MRHMLCNKHCIPSAVGKCSVEVSGDVLGPVFPSLTLTCCHSELYELPNTAKAAMHQSMHSMITSLKRITSACQRSLLPYAA